MLTPHTARIQPRRILGPDNIKFLQDIALQITGERHGLSGCRVQRDRFGGPAIEIDVGSLEDVGKYHPESYGTFLACTVIPRGEAQAGELSKLGHDDRARALNRLLRDARQIDSTIWWVLSTAAMRRLLFPAAYAEKRTDAVRYMNCPRDFHRGRVVMLSDLSPQGVERYAKYAAKMIGADQLPAALTPTTITD